MGREEKVDVERVYKMAQKGWKFAESIGVTTDVYELVQDDEASDYLHEKAWETGDAELVGSLLFMTLPFENPLPQLIDDIDVSIISFCTIYLNDFDNMETPYNHTAEEVLKVYDSLNGNFKTADVLNDFRTHGVCTYLLHKFVNRYKDFTKELSAPMKIDPDGSVMGEICRRFDNANIIVGYWLSEAYKDAIKAGTSEDYKKWFDFAVDSFINESVKIMDKPYMSPFGFSFKLSEDIATIAACLFDSLLFSDDEDDCIYNRFVNSIAGEGR